MRRPIIIVAFCLFLVAPLTEAQGILTMNKPDPNVPPLGVQLKRAVVNIELKCKAGDKLVSSSGTGFLVGVTDPRLQKGQSFQYLVTNRHVAQCWDENNNPMVIQSEKIRFNTKDGSSRWLDANPAAWSFPVDDSTDLAATPVSLPDGLLATLINVDDFATKDYMTANQIAEGSPIILSGYFYQIPGDLRFEAIVRQGILSMVPDEPIKTTTGKPGMVYLCDAHIFGGNSGSPVMVTANWLGMGGYHLLGVVSGYYFEDSDFNLEIATTVKGTERANSGVAMVVPADFVRALLDQPELKGPREAFIALHPIAPAPTPGPTR
jgi:S1-C subfamily serine protease